MIQSNFFCKVRVVKSRKNAVQVSDFARIFASYLGLHGSRQPDNAECVANKQVKRDWSASTIPCEATDISAWACTSSPVAALSH